MTTYCCSSKEEVVTMTLVCDSQYACFSQYLESGPTKHIEADFHYDG